MGNCQAAEVATVVIQHPGGGRTERAYWAMSAGAVMAANPGHYVAAVITSPPAAGASSATPAAAPVKHLKLLRPDDTLLLGRVYRLVSFEGTHVLVHTPRRLLWLHCACAAPRARLRLKVGQIQSFGCARKHAAIGSTLMIKMSSCPSRSQKLHFFLTKTAGEPFTLLFWCRL